jgi:iron-sulfur cluster repair protein YtfE (RIC family)
MSTATTLLHPSRTAQQLSSEHVDLERRFDSLWQRARDGQWAGLDAEVLAFAGDVATHFHFEDEVIFPGIARRNLASAELIRRLVAEHAAMQQLLEEIVEQFGRHEVRTTTLEIFLDLWREHAALEDARIYGRIEPQAEPLLRTR